MIVSEHFEEQETVARSRRIDRRHVGGVCDAVFGIFGGVGSEGDHDSARIDRSDGYRPYGVRRHINGEGIAE